MTGERRIHNTAGGSALDARAARCFIGHGDTVFLQVAAGNIASLRAVLAAGFKPVGAQVRFIEREGEPA